MASIGVKPRVPSIDWGNPLAKGLVFDAALFEGGGVNTWDIVSKYKGVINASGATWANNKYGKDLDFSAAASKVTYKALGITSGPLSVETLALCRSAGGNTLGRFMDNTIVILYQTSGAPARAIWASTFATADNQVTVPFTPTDGLWHHWVGTCSDVSSTSGTMILYQDGTLPTQTTSGGSGAKTSDVALCVGGRNADTARTFDGIIAYCRVYKRVLKAGEVRQLYSNPWQIYRRPSPDF